MIGLKANKDLTLETPWDTYKILKMLLKRMDWPMLFTDNPYVIQPCNVFFMHMILMDSENKLVMNLGETCLVTENSNERLGRQKLDLVIL